MKLIKIKSCRQGIPFGKHFVINEEHIINVEQIASITQYGNNYSINLSSGLDYEINDRESINRLFKALDWSKEE